MDLKITIKGNKACYEKKQEIEKTEISIVDNLDKIPKSSIQIKQDGKTCLVHNVELMSNAAKKIKELGVEIFSNSPIEDIVILRNCNGFQIKSYEEKSLLLSAFLIYDLVQELRKINEDLAESFTLNWDQLILESKIYTIDDKFLSPEYEKYIDKLIHINLLATAQITNSMFNYKFLFLTSVDNLRKPKSYFFQNISNEPQKLYDFWKLMLKMSDLF